MSGREEEPMACVRWRFSSERVPGVTIIGSHKVRALSDARKIAARMNAEYGEGTHWVEPLNQTWSESHE